MSDDSRVCRGECDCDGPSCPARDGGFFCTRSEGHPKQHSACGDRHDIHVWGDPESASDTPRRDGSTPPDPAASEPTLDDLLTSLNSKLYQAASHITERAEHANLARGNGHHMAQKISMLGVYLLAGRMRDHLPLTDRQRWLIRRVEEIADDIFHEGQPRGDR